MPLGKVEKYEFHLLAIRAVLKVGISREQGRKPALLRFACFVRCAVKSPVLSGVSGSAKN